MREAFRAPEELAPGLGVLKTGMKAVSGLLLLGTLGFTVPSDPPQGLERGPSMRLSNASEMQLDSLYGPLTYLMKPDERGIYPGLTVAGKREFLRQFWAERNPTPGSARNAAAEAYNARIGVVNKKFRVMGAKELPGWSTDRGRIYLEYGKPDLVLTRRGPGVFMPYEVWKYNNGHKYCFADLTRFGEYVLVYSTDPNETNRPNLGTLIGDEAYEDAMRF